MLTKYITEGIETLFNADLLNYIVKKFIANGWDVNWNNLTKEEYWSKVAPLLERTNLSQSDIEQRKLKNKKE